MALFLIRYGEIGLKSRRVRSRFDRALKDNIARRFMAAGRECRLESDRGRIYLWADDQDLAKGVLARTFGVVSFSPAAETRTDMESVSGAAVEAARPLFLADGMSFRITARRTGQHDYTSMELAAEVGSAVFVAYEHLHPRVDLTTPDVNIFVEVRQGRAFVHTRKIPGPGGMPLGTQGRVLGIVDRERDIAACWLMMKRGCRVMAVAKEPGLAEPLRTWDPDLRILEPGSITKLADRNRAEGIALGWGMADYDSRRGEIEGLGMPVFFPLIGMDDAGIDDIMARIRGKQAECR